ncbi:ABC transporter permease, partial [Photobacterium damselae subsp. damselae]|nr:ABC transporter permease [Photobacterium damselae subsp. damselae]
MLQSLYRIKAIMLKEVRQLSRDRITFGMVVMIPLIQLLLFGYAINTDVRNIPVAVVDQSQSVLGREVVQSIKATQVIAVQEHLLTPKQAEQAIVDGRVRAALILPADLANRMENRLTVGQWLVDGSDSMISSALMQLSNMPLPISSHYQSANRKSFDVALFFNPERRSAVNIVPGLLGVILTMTMILFTSA